MAETIVLDPTAILASRTQLDITAFVAADGVDWGDGAIQEYLADQSVGSTVVDYRIPNRTIRLPLRLRAVSGTTFATIRTNLQAKVALLQREGGALMRQVGATALYADVVNATLHLGGSLLQAIRSFDVDAWLELECVPDWYGDEVTLSDHVETTLPHLIFTEATVNGNYPGRVRLIVDNDQATDQHGLIWGFRSKNYDAAASASLFIRGMDMTFVNGAAQGTQSGSVGTSSHTASITNPPTGAWISFVSTTLSSGPTPLTHQGTYRVWARVYVSAAGTQFRFQWANGTLSVPITNDPKLTPDVSNFYILDMGVVRLTAPAVGSNQWFGAFQIMTAAATSTSHLDCMWLQPLDEGAGVATYTPTTPASNVTVSQHGATGADDGATGTVAWTNPGNATVEDSNVASITLSAGQTSHWLKVTNCSYSLPSSATVTGIKLTFYYSVGAGWGTFSGGLTPRLVKAGTVQAGLPTVYGGSDMFGSEQRTSWGGPNDLWGGTWLYSDINNSGFGGAGAFVLTASPVPIVFWINYMVTTVYVTLAGGFTVALDAVIYASSTAELRTEGMLRKGSSSTIYAPMGNAIGSLPRIPPSGLEGRTVQVLLKASRGNFANEADSGIDDMSCQIKYRPSYLYTT